MASAGGDGSYGVQWVGAIVIGYVEGEGGRRKTETVRRCHRRLCEVIRDSRWCLGAREHEGETAGWHAGLVSRVRHAIILQVIPVPS